MYGCYICNGDREFMEYFCQSCAKVRRYIMNFGSTDVLESIESVYIRQEKRVPKQVIDEEPKTKKGKKNEG